MRSCGHEAVTFSLRKWSCRLARGLGVEADGVLRPRSGTPSRTATRDRRLGDEPRFPWVASCRSPDGNGGTLTGSGDTKKEGCQARPAS